MDIIKATSLQYTAFKYNCIGIMFTMIQKVRKERKPPTIHIWEVENIELGDWRCFALNKLQTILKLFSNDQLKKSSAWNKINLQFSITFLNKCWTLKLVCLSVIYECSCKFVPSVHCNLTTVETLLWLYTPSHMESSWEMCLFTIICSSRTTHLSKCWYEPVEQWHIYSSTVKYPASFWYIY